MRYQDAALEGHIPSDAHSALKFRAMLVDWHHGFGRLSLLPGSESLLESAHGGEAADGGGGVPVPVGSVPICWLLRTAGQGEAEAQDRAGATSCVFRPWHTVLPAAEKIYFVTNLIPDALPHIPHTTEYLKTRRRP